MLESGDEFTRASFAPLTAALYARHVRGSRALRVAASGGEDLIGEPTEVVKTIFFADFFFLSHNFAFFSISALLYWKKEKSFEFCQLFGFLDSCF